MLHLIWEVTHDANIEYSILAHTVVKAASSERLRDMEQENRSEEGENEKKHPQAPSTDSPQLRPLFKEKFDQSENEKELQKNIWDHS